MKLEFDKEQQILHIPDKLKNQYLAVKLLLFVNLFNGALFLYTRNKTDMGVGFRYLWIGLILISIFALYMLFFKKSTTNDLALQEIDSWKKRSPLGKSLLRLNLRDGKARELPFLKKEEDQEEAIRLFKELGILEK